MASGNGKPAPPSAATLRRILTRAKITEAGQEAFTRTRHAIARARQRRMHAQRARKGH